MKQHLLSAVTLVAVVAGSLSPALALAGESRTPSPSRSVPPMREELKERREGFREEVKERLSNIRKERINNWVRRMQKRLGGLIERQYKLADKISDKIERAAAAGKDVARPRALLAEARAKIDVAKRALADMTGQVESILADNPPREAFAKIHELQKSVFDKIREAHRALVAVLTALKGIGGSVTPTPTP